MKERELVIIVKDGGWYAIYKGKHLTAQETAALVAKGLPYHFGKVKP